MALFGVVGSMNRTRTDVAVVEADGESFGAVTAADLATAL